MNSQQLNFMEAVKRLLDIPGWDMLTDNGIVALKSPAAIPLVNMVWGNPTRLTLEIVEEFYKESSYFWLTEHAIEDSDLKFPKNYELFPEMHLDLTSYPVYFNNSKIEIIQPISDEDLAVWAETALATFGFRINDFNDFFMPLIQLAGSVPFLVLYDNQPAATSLAYCGDNEVGIYAMSTKGAFRRKGCGTAAANACLSLAKDRGLKRAVLYASRLGQHLYKTMGFLASAIWYEYRFK